MTRLHRSVSCALASSALVIACGAGAPGGAAPARDLADEEAAGPGAIGFVLGAPLDEATAGLGAASPDAEAAAGEGAVIRQGVVSRSGRAWRTHLTFFGGRLARISAHTSPVSIADYDAIVAELTAALGDGESSICASEVGPPLAAYLASGRGGMRTHWGARGWAQLSPIAADTLQLQIFVQDPAVTSAHPDELDAKGGHAKQATAARCAEVGADPPGVAGLVFGASLEDVQTALGTAEDLTRFDAVIPHRLAGVDGELRLRFYDGCLALLMFTAPASLDSYETLQGALLPQMGDPTRRERCTPRGDAPTAAELGAGRVTLQTLWNTDALRGSLRLTSRPDDATITFEASSVALAPRAPSIDFSGP